MLHEAAKSIAVSIGFVPEKLEVGKNSALEKLDFFFFFFLNEVGDLCMCCVCVLSVGVVDVIK